MLPQTAAEPLEGNAKYEKVRTIGVGQRSAVQAARNKVTGELVAIKFIPRGWEPSHTKYVIREILNHQELSQSKHPHIVEFKEVFVTPRYLAEVLEYVEGETLQVFLEKVGGKLIEGLARFIFQQLIIALDFCHRKGKINRDVKLSNILLSIAEGQLPLVKLCDFGFSKDTYRHSEPHSQVGTALFVSPEVIQNTGGGRYDGQAADLWACGVCLFIMLFGRHPYLRPEDSKLSEQQQMIKLFQRMMQGPLEFPPELVGGMSPECLDLLTRLLRTDPTQRITMADIQRHPWFTTALPEGAGLMNDLFLAEDSTKGLSPQSQQQIEAFVTMAAQVGDMPQARVQMPAQAPGPGQAGLPIPHGMGVGGHVGAMGGVLQPVQPAGMAGMAGVSAQGSPQLGYPPPQPPAPYSVTVPPTFAQPLSMSPAPMMGVGPGVGVGMGLGDSNAYQAAMPPVSQYNQPTALHHPQQQPQQQPAQMYGMQPTQQHPGPHLTPPQAVHTPPVAVGGLQPNGLMGHIPDLDAMVMNMNETDLLQAATVDITHPTQAGPAAHSVSASNPQTLQAQQQADAAAAAQAHAHRVFANRLSSLAPGSVTSSQAASVSYGRAPSGILEPGSGSVQGVASPGAVPQAVVDPAPFLYEGEDDELPLVGSVSALMPQFDWGSFNALASSGTLQASGFFQSSAFTRMARQALASQGRSSTPSSVISPDSLMHQQILTMQLSTGASGLPAPGLQPSSGTPSGTGPNPLPPNNMMG